MPSKRLAIKDKWLRVPDGVDPLLRAHVAPCRSLNCACRRVAFNVDKWRPELPVITEAIRGHVGQLDVKGPLDNAIALAEEGATWFSWSISGDKFYAGCSVCNAVEQKGWQFITDEQCRLPKLKRHAAGPNHIANVYQILGHMVERSRAAPSADNFMAALRHLQAGGAGTLHGVAGRIKLNMIEFAIVEAVRDTCSLAAAESSSGSVERGECHARSGKTSRPGQSLDNSCLDSISNNRQIDMCFWGFEFNKTVGWSVYYWPHILSNNIQVILLVRPSCDTDYLEVISNGSLGRGLVALTRGSGATM